MRKRGVRRNYGEEVKEGVVGKRVGRRGENTKGKGESRVTTGDSERRDTIPNLRKRVGREQTRARQEGGLGREEG